MPKLLSLSLNESGVEADNDDRDGRDIAIERDERSRTYFVYIEFNEIKFMRQTKSWDRKFEIKSVIGLVSITNKYHK